MTHSDPTVFYLCGKSPEEGDLLALGVDTALEIPMASPDAPERISAFIDQQRDYVFAVFSYDLKDSIESQISTRQTDDTAPVAVLVVAQHVALCFPDRIEIIKGDAFMLASWYDNFLQCDTRTTAGIGMQQRISKAQYLSDVNQLLQHIQRGDIYEVNYCMEWFAEERLTDPMRVFASLFHNTRAPMSAYVAWKHWHLLCGSPERFLRKKGSRIESQPIKGTAPRGSNQAEDFRLRRLLSENQKERSENIMITDLVRNDLSRIAARGSVKVDELCGIYSFPTVHQMISTVSCTLRDTVDVSGVLRATFPMGSMTGAPKVRAMQLIDQYEHNRRGWYSGSVGFFTPEGDFDLNVVIRSIICNSARPYLSCWAGSAITAACDPEQEYAECLLKAGAMLDLLGGANLQP
ncbi:MAG: anthranilate synthase component I family protein [Flavobacteriales bacterium]|nr:anthranilate synthase component I family protein [Flavobacteriales bacterium]